MWVIPEQGSCSLVASHPDNKHSVFQGRTCTRWHAEIQVLKQSLLNPLAFAFFLKKRDKAREREGGGMFVCWLVA